jgi:hypothetical protein
MVAHISAKQSAPRHRRDSLSHLDGRLNAHANMPTVTSVYHFLITQYNTDTHNVRTLTLTNTRTQTLPLSIYIYNLQN